jgi:hypothetical protein
VLTKAENCRRKQASKILAKQKATLSFDTLRWREGGVRVAPILKSRRSFDGIQRPLKPAVFSKNQGSIRSRLPNNPAEKNPAQNESLSKAQNLQASSFFPSSNSTPTSGFLTMSSNAAVAFRDPLSFQLNSSSSSSEKETHILKASSDLLGQCPAILPNFVLRSIK